MESLLLPKTVNTIALNTWSLKLTLESTTWIHVVEQHWIMQMVILKNCLRSTVERQVQNLKSESLIYRPLTWRIKIKLMTYISYPNPQRAD